VETDWYLEARTADGVRVMHELHRLPFRVGRDPLCDLVAPANGLSRRHAELDADICGRLRLRDLDSTNGSYVNRRRVHGSVLLEDNDTIHFAQAEYRVRRRLDDDVLSPPEPDDGAIRAGRRAACARRKDPDLVALERQFDELLRGRGLGGALQPIVDTRRREPRAYEWLGRACHPGLPQSPLPLFRLAARLGRESELSRAFRELGVHAVRGQRKETTLFVNTHPKETFDLGFLQTLAQLQAQPGAPQIVVEVHETATSERERMRALAASLRGIGVRMAWEDFGAGADPLATLTDVPVDYVKFDMSLIRGIDMASRRKQTLVGDLVRRARDQGAVPLAEGVETEAEAEICRLMGFKLLQGYLTGKPAPAEVAGASSA